VARQDTAVLGVGATQDLAQKAAAAADVVYAAFTARDVDARAEMLAQVCADDVSYSNPLGSTVGIPPLAALFTELADRYPGHRPTRTTGVDAHHNAIRYHWTLRDRSGQNVLDGVDVVHFTADARLTSILTFFGFPPLIRYTYQA
jgi:hypothetical protein